MECCQKIVPNAWRFFTSRFGSAFRYLVEITNSCQKQTKAGDGNYLELEYTVLDGEHKGARHWDRLCLEHPNPKAVSRAYAALSAVCHSVGILQFEETVELHHLPFQITVRNRTDDSGRVSAEVAAYAPRPTFSNNATNSSATPNQQTAGRNPGSNPWGRPSQNGTP
ncbi:MAG TPA: hypothetical protein DEB39_10655 [Planctomycetaceae bacterium]|nr:hypothetical protein [Planctomycetaceae bacterium]